MATPPPADAIPAPSVSSVGATASATSIPVPEVTNPVPAAPLSNSAPSSAPASPALVKPASKNEESFRSLFELPADKLLDDFSCALQLKSLLLHGRLYISDNNICFHANILGRKTTKIIPYSKIIGVYKRNTAIVFSNAIEIMTRKTKYFFSSFMFRDGAYKIFAQAWSDATPETVGRVILKADGAELFLKPNISGDIPFATSSSTDEDSSSDSEMPPASPVKTSASSPAIPVRTRKSTDSQPRDAAETPPDSAIAQLPVDPTQTSNLDGSSLVTRKLRRGSQPAEISTPGTQVKKRKKSSGGSRSKGSVSSRKITDPTSTVEAAAMVLRQKVREQEEALAPDDDGWLSADKVLDIANDDTSQVKRAPQPTAPRTSRAGSSGAPTDAASLPILSSKDTTTLSRTPDPVIPATHQYAPSSRPTTLMHQFDETQIDSFMATKPPIRETSCNHILDAKSDTGTSSSLIEKEIRNLTVQQFYLLFWYNPQWWSDWARTLEWTEFTWTDWQPTAPDNCCIFRVNNYRMPLKQNLGPKSTRVEAEVHVKFKNKYHMLVEISAVSKDVPFGDAFTTHEKWSIIQTGTNLKIHVTLSIRWKKAAWGFRSTIEKKTQEATKSQAELWFHVAQPIIDQYQRGMHEFEIQQQDRSRISSTSLPQSVQNATSALNASVSALQQLSRSDSDSESDDEQREKKDNAALIRHIRKNSSFSGELPVSISSQSQVPSPRTSVPTKSHSRRTSEVNRAALGLDNSQPSVIELETSSWKHSILLALGSLVLILVLGFSMSFMMTGTQPAVARGKDLPSNRVDLQYIAFLEYMVGSLLRNVSNPGSFMRQEERFFKASQDLELRLRQLTSYTAELAAHLKSFRDASKDLERVDFELESSSRDQLAGSLYDFYRDKASVILESNGAQPNSPTALSQSIRSSPWHIYLSYVLGSLLLAIAIAFVVLKFSGVSAPVHIPFLSDLL